MPRLVSLCTPLALFPFPQRIGNKSPPEILFKYVGFRLEIQTQITVKYFFFDLLVAVTNTSSTSSRSTSDLNDFVVVEKEKKKKIGLSGVFPFVVQREAPSLVLPTPSPRLLAGVSFSERD